jgi:hypothetical protein
MKGKIITLLISLFLLSAPNVQAQDFCKGDFNYNGSVGAEDVSVFLEHFGRSQFNNPCPPDGPTPVPKTGQTTSYATGDDGDLQRGVTLVTPRFTDNGDGTVTDNQTGLIWMKDAVCFGAGTWSNALSDCSGLSDGQCGLTDDSSVGDWRLPNKKELISLTHDEYDTPILCNTMGTGKWTDDDPFTNVQLDGYWTSTTTFLSDRAWGMSMTIGSLDAQYKIGSLYVWCVRGGH